MTKHDEDLIEQARHTVWEKMDSLIEQCESDEAADAIRKMQHHDYLYEKCKMDAWIDTFVDEECVDDDCDD